MPLAVTRLEILQVRKLIQCVRQQDSAQIAKLVELGIYGVIDYQGKCIYFQYLCQMCREMHLHAYLTPY